MRYTSMRAYYNTQSKEQRMQRHHALCKEFFEIANVACDFETGT